MSTPSRRDILTVAAATAALPVLESALGTMKSTQAAAAPAPAPATPARAPAVPEKAGFFATAIKPADVKADQFTAVTGHKIVLSRTDKTITALTSVCTHKQCNMLPKADSKTLDCSCHKSSFNLDGSVAKAPATKPLDHYAIRVNADGVIEIDPGKGLAKDDKDASLTVS